MILSIIRAFFPEVQALCVLTVRIVTRSRIPSGIQQFFIELLLFVLLPAGRGFVTHILEEVEHNLFASEHLDRVYKLLNICR